MAQKQKEIRKGIYTSHDDRHGNGIYIGDFVRAKNGRVYEVNRYCNLYNPAVGHVKISVDLGLELTTQEEFREEVRRCEANGPGRGKWARKTEKEP